MRLLEKKKSFIQILIYERNYLPDDVRAKRGKTKSMTVYETTLEEVTAVIKEALGGKK
ncbi:hypothetical protein LCGC14_0922650 [marine sediment metagenome]|uniref:Uncharacterized protein n=1 Tax=marine sediment metagenome TaxID=412755 RepID=A0A0F9NQD1_9ZZZZ